MPSVKHYNGSRDRDSPDDMISNRGRSGRSSSMDYSALSASDQTVNRFTIPHRFWIALMAFLGCTITFILRTSMSIAILAMVQPIANTAGNMTADLPDFGPRYSWSPYQQSTVLGAFFYGTSISGLPFGLLVDRYGCVRSFMFWSCVIATVMQLITPLVAFSFAVTFVVRLVCGISQGVLYPAMHKLFTKWAPPNELGRFMSTMMGGNFGTIFSWALSGVLIERFGWEYSFYGTGVLTLAFCTLWWVLVYDSPAEHPRITRSERRFIEESLVDVNWEKSWAPLGKVMTSVPALAMMVLQYGNLWGFLFLVTGAPKFMNQVLGFDLAKTGFLASLPYIARVLSGVVFAMMNDALRTKMTKMNLRRLFCIFSHIIPGMLLAALPFVPADPYWCVFLITLSFGFNGAVTQTAFANVHDLSPNYAASLLSISNGIGGTSGFVTPLVVTYFTWDNNTFDGWTNVFLIGAAAYIVPAIIFMVFGSADVQPWNNAAGNANKLEMHEMNHDRLMDDKDNKKKPTIV